MHIKNTIFVLIFMLCGLSLVSGQQQVQKANKQYDDFSFLDAVNAFEYLHKRGHNKKEIYQKLGDANYLNADYEAARKWYGKLMDIEGMETNTKYVHRYAQVLRSTNEDELAKEWTLKLLSSGGLKKNAEASIENLEKDLSGSRGINYAYEVEPLNINSEKSEFAPSIYGDKLVFASARKKGFLVKVTHEWNKQPFLDLYQVPLDSAKQEPKKVSKFLKGLNKKTHESSTAFTKDGQTVYFTRNNSKKGKLFMRDKNGISRLKIFKAQLVDSVWTNIKELPFNNDAYSVAHPCLGPNEKVLYFSSDMPGTNGESDIFKVDILEDGTFGDPKNLGPEVNTAFRESFPHVTKDNMLYFASDGHPGLGGLDIFSANLVNLGNGVTHLAAPLNGPADDFSIIFQENGKKGFFASNRGGGNGFDDLYAFTRTEVKTNTKAEISEQDLADVKGESITEVAPETMLEAEEAPLADLATLGLDKIYFDFDATAITQKAEKTLDEVAQLLLENADWKLNIATHTDSRGNMYYNQKLSERRLSVAEQYLLNKGVGAQQLQGEALGETQLVNNCDETQNCGRQAHAANRRANLTLTR